MGNGYCEKDYSKDEVNVVEFTQIRLQKMKKSYDRFLLLG